MPDQPDAGADRSLRLNRWLWAFVLAGTILRLTRYAMGQPIWNDEGLIGNNIATRGYRALLEPLDSIQVAPIGFLWIERAALQFLGMSEFAMRLAPTLAGILALILFAFLARLLLAPAAATIATAIFAVSDLLLRHCVELKPYGFDLLAAVALLLAASHFILNRETRSLVALTVLTPFALAFSIPAVFVAGGIAVVLLLMLTRLPRSTRVLAGIYSIIVAASFLLIYGRMLTPRFSNVATGMRGYWSASFPPAGLLPFIAWFIRIHTGQMFAYPQNGYDGWCAPNFILFLIGTFLWLRMPARRAIAACLLLPFAFNLLAAGLKKYPYGDSARIVQHLVPAIILLLSAGGMSLVDHYAKTIKGRHTVIIAVFIVLSVFFLIGEFWPLAHPGKGSLSDARVRQFVQTHLPAPAPDVTVVCLQPPAQVNTVLLWYLYKSHLPILWNAQPGGSWTHASGPIWVVSAIVPTDLKETLQHALGRQAILEIHEVFTPDSQCDVLKFPAISQADN